MNSIDGSCTTKISLYSNILPPGGGASAARMAALHAGIPVVTAINTEPTIANEIQIDIGIGAGVESMTHGYGAGASEFSDEILENKDAGDCLLPMGITSENVAADCGITRDTQDAFAAREGKFKDEIVPIKAKWVDPKTEKVMEVVESLGKLKPAFKKDGSTHAGAFLLSSFTSYFVLIHLVQVTPRKSLTVAAAVLLARRSVAKRLGLPIVGKFITSAVVSVPPRVMGIGPAFAIPRVLQTAQISSSDIDFYEINEAFASQAVIGEVNLNGGGIALGHPLGATGARQVATGLAVAKQSGGRVFVTSMCIGSGMGMAAVFVSEH
ncbi:acetyl-CoA acetyl transferase [Coprinopsis sp. MPI-PUGE-AT-0042]|nr:acetyl-CoA acetyl transferase [Coprinopsis sp. MPI-PUGE-AT-0042]